MKKIAEKTKIQQTNKYLVFVLMISSLLTTSVFATELDDVFGNGLTFGDKDSNYFIKFNARLQSRFDGTYEESDEDSSFTKKYFFRRGRIKSDGFVFSPKLRYKMEYDIINSQMLDAVIKWNFAGNFDLWVGQTKLPGNRERIISSQKLQFVDRSLLNSRFNIDRDRGIQLRHHFNKGKMLIRESFAISKGEGRKHKGPSKGNEYTGKIEILPFGAFTKKGDYYGGDLKREPEPKLALALSYDYNDDAVKARGQLGDVLSESRDLKTVFVDMMYKHKGLSVMAELANKKTADGSPAIFNTDGDLIESFYTGSAFNAQVGYLFNNDWELAGRFTAVNPESETQNNDLTQYTIGVSKYIVGHDFKVQSDLSLLNEDNKNDKYIFRLQFELAF